MIVEIRHALRSLARARGFAASAMLTLALGAGATTAVFSVVNAALWRPLPYPAAGRLVAMQETRGADEISVSYPDFRDWREQSRSFRELALYTGLSFNLTGIGEPERLRGEMVTANLFRTLGVRPALGREFRPEEDEPGAPNVVAISDGMWRTHFGSDPAILGRTVVLSAVPYTVVAVMPPGFRFADGIVFGPADLWVPLSALGADRTIRSSHPGLVAIGALRPGVTLAEARTELDAIAARLRASYPESNYRVGVSVETALDRVVGGLRPALWLFVGAAGVVLLIACANVAALILTRVISIRRELAIRTALGASRWRLAKQLCAEGGVLAVGGAVVGVAVAATLLRAGTSLIGSLPRLNDVHIDGAVLLIALGAAGLTTLVFGAVPAWWVGRADPERWLTARGESGGAASAGLRRFLVGGEVGLSVILLVTAGLLAKSLVRLVADPGGIDPRGVLTFGVRLPETEYSDARANQFVRTMSDRLRALPGVTAAGGISVLPFQAAGAQSGIRPFGTPARPENERRTDVAVATPDYFRAMGIRLLRGRAFTDQDGPDAPKVAIVDPQFAAAFWPGQDPVGQRVSGWGFDTLTVVGEAEHVANYGIGGDSREQLYVPHSQRPFKRYTFVVRGTLDARALAPAVRHEVAGLDPNLPTFAMVTMEDVVASTVLTPRLGATLSGSFALVALLLAAVGVYGLAAYLVARRTREIGVRLALGGTPASVLRLISWESLRPGVVGAIVGLGGALGATRVLRSQVYGVSVTDPVILMAVPIVLLLVAAAAGAVPAFRASRISPVEALQRD